MQNFKKIWLFLVVGLVISFGCKGEAIDLQSLKDKTDKQKISSLPSVVAAGIAGYGYYRLLAMQVGHTGDNKAISLMEKVHWKVRGSIVGTLSRKILGHKSFQEQLNSSLCQATDGVLRGGLFLATVYGCYRVVSGVARVTHTLAHRGKWAMHLAHTLQSQVKLVAMLNSVRSELTHLVSSFDDQNVAALVMASGITNKCDRLIEKHSATLAAVLDGIAELTNRYADVSGCHLLDSDIQKVIHAADHDIYALAQGNSLNRIGVIACVNDNHDLLNAITKLYEGCDLMHEGNYTSLWKGARKANESVREVLKHTSRALRRNDTQLNDALKSCERMMWWKSKLSSLPIINSLV